MLVLLLLELSRNSTSASSDVGAIRNSFFLALGIRHIQVAVKVVLVDVADNIVGDQEVD